MNAARDAYQGIQTIRAEELLRHTGHIRVRALLLRCRANDAASMVRPLLSHLRS